MHQVAEPKRGGMVVGPGHNPDGSPGGGVPFVLEDTGKHIEEEGFEINIPNELRDLPGMHTFHGKNIEVLNQILALADPPLSITDKVQNVRSRDIVICVRSAWDDTEREFIGTIEEILHQINTSKGCKPIPLSTKPQGTAKEGGEIVVLNAKGGYNYAGEDKVTAKRCGLMTLPTTIPGTNCGNCIFFSSGFCDHSKVLLPVTSRQCCQFWDDKSFRSHLTNIWQADFFADRSVQYPLNKEGGYDYTGKALDRAREADLITLPEDIKGTNCADTNCMYGKKGLCVHPRIMLPITDRMSCAWWDNTDVKRPWGAPVEIEFLGEGGPIHSKARKKDWQAEYPNSPRWKKKKESLQELSNSIHRLRLKVGKDIGSEDERTALTALVVAIMDRSAERIGNDDSADNGHFGVTGFRKDHIRVVGNKVHLDYVGKSGTKHDKSISDLRISKALKKAIKNAPGDFIFETSDGFRVKCDKVNRYLEQFNISAKDLRGYNANKWIIEELKRSKVTSEDPEKAKKERKKIFNKAVKQVADRVGHGAATLKKHYMIPELPIQYIQHGRIIDMKNIGYYLDGGPLGDLRAENYFANKNEVPDAVNKKVEEIHKESEEEGIDKVFNAREVKTVDWQDVVPTQDFLRSSKFAKVEGVEDLYSINLPWAIEYQGKYYINDGHHRAVEMHKRNLPIKLHVYPVETILAKGGEIKSGAGAPVLLSFADDAALLLLNEGGEPTLSEDKEKEAQAAAKKLLDSLSDADIQEIKDGMKAIINNTIVEEETKLNDLLAKKDALKSEGEELYKQEKLLTFGPEKSTLTVRRQKIYFDLGALDPLILHQQNIVKAIKNGGDITSFTDKKGLDHTKIPFFSNIKTDNISFDEETILIDPVPVYMPFVNEKVFRDKGYVFDAIRFSKDKYLIAVNGYSERKESYYRETSTVVTHPTDAEQGYVITTLDQLALMSDYYYTKARAQAQKEADERNERTEKYYDTLSRERRERHLNQKGFYNSLPVKVKKIITQADYEALSLEEKEKLYKPIKRYGPERLKSRLDDSHMWRSYHNMYERFIDPQALHPAPRVAHPDAALYWQTFRDMMKWKIKDIQVQREVDSEVRKIALETSFGESNTNDVLKEQYGILVKRQNGTKIGPEEIEQIRKGWVLLNKTFGKLVGNAKNDNLKISHTGLKYVFASKAAGVYMPTMKTIAVTNKFGEAQFDQIFSHETAHWIDANMGALIGKRHATDDFESTAGLIASTFRDNMNAQSDSDYVNSTVECFARAMEQYFAWENYGEETELLYSYGELKEVRTYHSEEKYVSKENFNNKIKPLIKKFLEENQEWFKFGIESENLPQIQSTKKPTKPMIQSDTQLHFFKEGGGTEMPEIKTWAQVKSFLEGELPKKLPGKHEKISFSDIKGDKNFDSLNIKPIPYKIKKSDEPLKEIVSDDELRPAMTAIHYNAEAKEKVATDANVLVIIKDDSIITTKNINPETGEEVKEKYPNYPYVIPRDNAYKLHLSEDVILSLLDQLNGIARSRRFLDWRSEKVVAKFSTDDIELYLNPDFVLKAINALWEYGAREIDMEFSSPNRAVMLIDSRKNGNKALVMPIMWADDLIPVIILDKDTLSAPRAPKVVSAPVPVPKVATGKTPVARMPEPKKDRKAPNTIHSCAVRLGRKGGKASAKARAKMINGGEVEDTDPHDGSDVSEDSTEYLIDKELKPLIDKIRIQAIMPDYRDKTSDADILGMIVSKYNRWDGNKIKVTCSSAFEDANYHDAAAQVSKFVDGGGIDPVQLPFTLLAKFGPAPKGTDLRFNMHDEPYMLVYSKDPEAIEYAEKVKAAYPNISIQKYKEGGPADESYIPVKIIPFEKRKGWDNHFFSNDANYALYANQDKSYSVSVENMLPSPVTDAQFIIKAYKGFAKNGVELEVSPQFAITADGANDIAIDFMNKIDSKEIMNEGGGTETCGCFHTYLKTEKPELVEKMMDADVNSNPAIRTEVDEAYQAWKGGEMKDHGGPIPTSMEMSEDETRMYVQNMSEEDFNRLKPENKEKYAKYRSTKGNTTQVEWLAGKSNAGGINGYGKEGLKNIIAYSKQNPGNVYKVTDDNYSHIGKFWLKNGRFASIQTLGNPNYDFANHPMRLSGKEDVIYKFTKMNKK